MRWRWQREAAIGLCGLAVALADGTSSWANPPEGPEPELTSQALVEVRDLSGLIVSPDMRYAAVRVDQADVERNSYSLGWRIIRLADGVLVAQIPAGDPLFWESGALAPGEAQWMPQSQSIIYRALTGDSVQLHRLAVGGLETGEVVTRGEGDVVDFKVETDGSLYYRTGPARTELEQADKAEFLKGTRLDASVNLLMPIVGGSLYDGKRTTLRLNAAANGPGFRTLLGNRPHRAFRLNFATQSVSPAEAVSPVVTGDRVRSGLVEAWAPVVSSTVRHFQRREVEIPTLKLAWQRAGGPVRMCEDPRCSGDISVLAWGGDARIFFWRREPLGRTGIYVFNTRSVVVENILVTDDQLGRDRYDRGPCPIAGQALVCVEASAGSPPRLIAIDLNTGRRRTLLDPNIDLRRSLTARISRLEWSSPLSDRTFGYLVMPDKASGAVPLVITQYVCGGFLRGGTGDEYPEHLLAQKGIAAICVSEAAVDNPRPGLDHPEQQGVLASHLALLDKLAQRGDIDMRRVGIAGLSSGADKTLYAISHSDRFAVAAVSGPTIDPISAYLGGATDHPWQILNPIYGVPAHHLPGLMTKAETDRWASFSPALRADRIRAPLLMQLADSEAAAASQLHAALSALHKPVETWIYADELHIKRHPAHKLKVYERSVAWFERWLRQKD